VVPPGVRDNRLLGEGDGGWSDGEEMSEGSKGESFAELGGRDVEAGPPSSAKARALPGGSSH
jgi:hypothetical protein